MRLQKGYRLLIATLASTMAYPAFSLDIGALRQIWPDNKQILASKVVNNQDQTAYVQIKLYKSVFQGNREKRTLLSKHTQMSYFSVSPHYLIIPPHQSRIIKYYFHGHRKNKHVVFYRAVFAPMSAPLVLKTTGKKVKTGISINIGYDVLLVIPPLHPTYALKASKQDGKIDLYNAGTGVYQLKTSTHCANNNSKMQLCSIKGNTVSTRLYPKQHIVLPLSDYQNHRVKFKIYHGATFYERKTFH